MGDLTDKELKNFKPKVKLYKVTDRDGMHARSHAKRGHFIPVSVPGKRAAGELDHRPL